jgi:hypothetical protein
MVGMDTECAARALENLDLTDEMIRETCLSLMARVPLLEAKWGVGVGLAEGEGDLEEELEGPAEGEAETLTTADEDLTRLEEGRKEAAKELLEDDTTEAL